MLHGVAEVVEVQTVVLQGAMSGEKLLGLHLDLVGRPNAQRVVDEGDGEEGDAGSPRDDGEAAKELQARVRKRREMKTRRGGSQRGYKHWFAREKQEEQEK
eukprot:764240-Hanusia_phi.AAC.5